MPIGGYTDYTNIADALIAQTGAVPSGNTGQAGLYNGNISGMITQVSEGILNGKVFAETFTYDQLHRIVGSAAGVSAISTDLGSFESFLDVNISNDFGSNYKYDANGNILNLGRSHLGRPIDDLSYTYNQLPSGMLEHNRLKIIDDAIGGAGVGDLDAVAGGYAYDAIGRLIEDPSERIGHIRWNIQNKVVRVEFTNGNPGVRYTYDAQGNRLTKENGTTFSFYVRDPQGNVLAIYEKTPDGMVQKEVHLYGASRVGIWNTNRLMGALATRKFNYTRGHRTYEQSDHLGNVLATITDLAHGVDETADKIAEYYTATVRYAALYYPFGWEIPSLTYSAMPDGNRYGFNGKENDKEWKIQDYGFRLYNQRIARFFSVDPLATGFPWFTPYQFAGNSPIKCIDLDGGEPTSHPNDWQFHENHPHGTMLRTPDNFWVFTTHYAPTDKYVNYYYDNNKWQTFSPNTVSAYSQRGLSESVKTITTEGGEVMLEVTHAGLDIAGFAHGGWGVAADGLNAAIYAAEGKTTDALFSLGGIVFGMAGDAIKMSRYSGKIADAAKTSEHSGKMADATDGCVSCGTLGKAGKMECFIEGTLIATTASALTIENISTEGTIITQDSEKSELFVYDIKLQIWVCVTCEDDLLRKLLKQLLSARRTPIRMISKN